MAKAQIPDDQSSAVMLTDKHGTIRYLNEFGQLHREGDLPAVIHDGGTYLYYYKDGLMHRDNGPALITTQHEVYYKKGEKHRDGDEPAVIHFIKKNDEKQILSQEYYQYGLRHRDSGPAMIWNNGSYEYYQNGKLHRDNGPATHYVTNNEGDIREEYWLNGEKKTNLSYKISKVREILTNDESKKSNKPRM